MAKTGRRREAGADTYSPESIREWSGPQACATRWSSLRQLNHERRVKGSRRLVAGRRSPVIDACIPTYLRQIRARDSHISRSSAHNRELSVRCRGDGDRTSEVGRILHRHTTAVARDERLLRARCACPAKWIEVSPLRRPRVGPGDGRPPEAGEAQASSTKSVGSEIAGRTPTRRIGRATCPGRGQPGRAGTALPFAVNVTSTLPRVALE